MQSLKDFIKESLENPSFTVIRNADEKPIEENSVNQEKTVDENQDVSDETEIRKLNNN